MALERYRHKRDFGITPEPRGRVAARQAKELAYVIQKHAASHLHYDFRLELGGVLLSWAVPKGPSLDPQDKRLAMHVEDHPLEYGGFEGVIPPKQYGAGTVMLWDRGTWIPEGDPVDGYRRGRLKFELDGEKLKGGWILVRTHSSRYNDGKQAWLLIKENDEYARRGVDARIVDEQPDSVASGRSLEKIAEDQQHVWRSDASVEANMRSGAVAAKSTKERAQKSGAQKSPVVSARRKQNAASETEIAGITLSNPDKLMFPETKYSKRDLAQYYEAVGDWIVPHLARRPLMLMRCPDGWKGECFYQKHANNSVHASVGRVQVPERNGTATYFAANSVSAVVGLLQWGVLEFHPWGSRAPRLDRPDRLIFDFDPDTGVDWRELVEAVQMLRALLDDLGLEGFLKTTGGKGLHVVVPIRPTLDWEVAKGFTRAIAESLVSTFPDRFTAVMSKSKRKGKIFVDYLRNGEGATAIAAYSLRARAKAPVSTPIAWSELDSDVRFDHFNLSTVLARLKAMKKDPWADFFSTRQSVTKAMFARVGL
ncbi:MAG: hypothetical protein E6H66_01105 [Betaproteobacteria bacterium]|nr:MAG: hypothetical protein E6H66_01105 [Betaproteobacteria bacterium]